MPSVLFKSLPLALISFAAISIAQPPPQTINPHTQIKWPVNCSDPHMAYNYTNNLCVHVGPVGNTGEVQVNQGGAWYSLPGFSYDFTTNTLTAPNIRIPGAANVVIPPAQVTWPPSCTTGVYVPATNTCVPTGTAANPAPPTGAGQMNAGGVFSAIPGFVNDANYGWNTAGGSCYAKGWQTGAGTNGVANAMASCVAIKVDPSYTTDAASLASNSWATRTPVSSLFDHGDYTTEVYRNPTTTATGGLTSPMRLGLTYVLAKMTGCYFDMSPLGSSGNIRTGCVYLQEFDMNPGWNYTGPGPGLALQTMNAFTINHIVSAAGTSENFPSSLHVHAAGDNANLYLQTYGQGGVVSSSAEGTKTFTGNTIEEVNAFAGAITNGTVTPVNPTFITTAPNTTMFPASQNYGLGTGRYLIPIGTCPSYPTNCTTAPPFTGQMTGVGAGIDNAGSSVSITTTAGTITPSTAYGTLVADVNTPQTGANVQPPTFATSMTFNVVIEGGTGGASSQFNTTELACFDTSYHECARPTAVTGGPGGTQTVTMPLRKLHVKSQTGGVTGHLYQGGMSGYCLNPLALTNTINAGQPIRYCYDVFGSRVLTGTLTSVPNATGGAITYTGTNLTGICGPGGQVQITGFTNPGNNGTYICSSSTATTVSIFNPNAVSESGASATITMQILQLGSFAYSLSTNASALTTLLGYTFNPGTAISSSGTTVTGNIDLPPSNRNFTLSPGMSLYISNTSGAPGSSIDGQCNNVQLIGNSTSNFTCTSPNLTGTRTNTSTKINAYLVNTACSGCSTTATSGQQIMSYALRPMAEVIDIRNNPTATSFSIASNVLTVQAAPNNLAIGMQVFLSGFSAANSYLNNQVVTLTARTTTSVSAAFTHADVTSTTDTGTLVPQPPVVDGSITLEPNVLGTLANNSYVEEVHHTASQFQVGAFVSVINNMFSVGHTVWTAGASGAGITNGGYTSAGVSLFKESNNNPDNMYQAAGGTATAPNFRRSTGAHFALLAADHFADGGATLAIQSPPNYQVNNPAFVAKIIDNQNKSGIANTTLTEIPNTGDTQFSTPGASVWSANSHFFNGSVSLTNDAGLVTGMAINYAPWSNQISSWSNGAGSVTCNITDDLGNQGCTMAGAINALQTLTGSPYTNMPQGTPFTIQARIKGNVGLESVTMSLNAQSTTATGASTTFNVSNAWANYCLPFVVSKPTTFGPNIVSSAGQTIFVSNVVVRPGYACGPPILTGANQVLTPTPVNSMTSLALNSPQTTVNCTTSGTAIFSMPLQGRSDKKVVAHLQNCNGNASYTYPVVFTNIPGVFPSNNLVALMPGLVPSNTTTAVTISTASSTLGTIVLEDY